MQLDYFKGKQLLDRYGIRSIASKYVGSASDAVKFAGGEPIVLKAISEKAMHKSKSGLVKLNLYDPHSIRAAYSELSKKAEKLKPYKIIAQKMSHGGVEVILGGREDAQFGKLVLLGLGGIYVEAFKDFALRVCPITRYDASQMIAQLKSRNVVTYNGRSEKLLEELLLKVSKLLSEHPEIKELDLNPAIIHENGYEIVDIRVLE
jgi:acyl-CoA synthetase (NDP forming)